MDKLIQETTPLGSISYTYNAIGRRTSMTIAGQPAVNYSYDANSRLTGINTTINSVASGFSIAYDAVGRRISLTLPNSVTTNYSYDNASRLLDITHQNTTQIIERLIYGYDVNGNRTNMERVSVPVKLPNPVTNASYNQTNQMLTFTPTTSSAKNMSYDENGNLLTVTNGCGTTNYTWDARNRLVGINGFKPDCSSLTASFKYDALGRRTDKTVNSVTTQYLYDSVDIIQEIQNSTVTANYIRGLNIDEPLARVKADGTVRYYQADALGSSVALTDESGAVKTQYSYDPYGSTTILGEASDNPFQYTGRENDNTGLYYYRVRYYSPELQRFISEDPIRFIGGINFFSYVNNQPTVMIDPYGLYIIAPGAGGPLDTRTDIALRCFENCIGREVIVTGASESGPPHKPGSAHETGQACDLGKNYNPNLKRKDVERCFDQCSGSNFPIGPQYSLSETLNFLSTAPEDRGFAWGYEGSSNYHFQSRPNRDGGTGFEPGVKRY